MYVFPYPTRVSLILSRLYRVWDFLRFFVSPPPTPDRAPRLSSLGSGPPYDATVSLGHRALRLAAVVAGYKLASPSLSRLPTHLSYHSVGSRAISPLHPTLYHRPRSRSRSRSCPHPCPRAHSCPRPRSRPHHRPCSRHCFLFSVPGALFSPRYHIVGQAPSLAPEAAGYLQALPPVYRDNAACGMAVPSSSRASFATLGKKYLVAGIY